MSIKKIKRNESIGVSLIAIGIIGFFISMSYFEIFGSRPDLSTEWTKLLVPFSSLLVAAGGAGFAVSGKRGVMTAISIFIFVFFVAIVSGLIIGAANEISTV